MARYDIKFGGSVGDERIFGELTLEGDGVSLDESQTRWVGMRAMNFANELAAQGVAVTPANVAKLAEAMATRVAGLFPGSSCRVTSLNVARRS